MTEMLLDGLRHLLALLFGIGVSAAFLDVAPTRQNIVYACLQMPPGTFCSGGSHSVPVLSDQQLDLNHTSDIPLP